MKEDVIEMVATDYTVILRCKSGKLFALDLGDLDSGWQLLPETPRISYTPKKKPQIQ